MLRDGDRASDKGRYLKIMEDFPIFSMLMCSRDVEKKLKEYSDIEKKQREEISSAFGVDVVVKKALPPNSALFIDHKKRIVAIYRDEELVYSPQIKYKRRGARKKEENPRKNRGKGEINGNKN